MRKIVISQGEKNFLADPLLSKVEAAVAAMLNQLIAEVLWEVRAYSLKKLCSKDVCLATLCERHLSNSEKNQSQRILPNERIFGEISGSQAVRGLILPQLLGCRATVQVPRFVSEPSYPCEPVTRVPVLEEWGRGQRLSKSF